MKRHSAKYQKRIFNSLFKPEEKRIKKPKQKTEEEIYAMWWLSKTSRNSMIRDIKNEKK